MAAAPVRNASRRVTRSPSNLPTFPRISKLQLLEILVAHRDVIEWLRRLIVLDKEVLDPGLLALREDALPVDLPLPDVGHLVLGRRAPVLHMDQRHAARPARKVRERILTGLRDPVQIDLELDELRIGALEQQVVGGLPVDLRELEIVIVVGELD